MNDNPFAPPRDLSTPSSNAPRDDAATRPEGGPTVQREGAFDAARRDERAGEDTDFTNDTIELTPGSHYPPSVPLSARSEATASPYAGSAFGAPQYARPGAAGPGYGPASHAQGGYTQPQYAAPQYAQPGPAHAAGGGSYGTPHRPQAPVGRVRRGTIAGIAAGALILGGAGGFGGAYLFDWLNPAGSSSATTSASTLPASSSSTLDRADSNTVAAIAEAAMPSVVSLEIIQNGQRASSGSGFIIREDGYVLTNNHVIEDAPSGGIQVLMSDGSIYAGTLVGASPEYDLAVVKIDAQDLTAIALGDSDALVVGDDVVAVGSPLGLDSTVTTGIVSALHRPVTAGDASSTAFIDAIQTDAAINPGNSGGPLLNAAGEVIGINSAVAALPGATQTTGAGSVGLGFAIPSNQARRTAEEIIETGEATYPVIGVLLDASYTGEGVRVGDVPSGSPADEAGIEAGDVITGIEGRVITRSDELIVAIRAMAPGDDVTFLIDRDGSEIEIDVTLVTDAEVNYGDQGVTSPRER
ncbi:trypsin-like peptidase domain-containing protein [Demequina pelophila]|uniref:trypsin-like peptidase domain-containing protein n=1 Tax=Demequina pelophila TaxID=1638984 RepID=UPI0007815FF0|nr:trypsin-like peptidase domain-containing protein [Demequina pelophila]